MTHAPFQFNLALAGLASPCGSRKAGKNRMLRSTRERRRAFDKEADKLIAEYATKYRANGPEALPPAAFAELEGKMKALSATFFR
jgi:hypothetical protein